MFNDFKKENKLVCVYGGNNNVKIFRNRLWIDFLMMTQMFNSLLYGDPIVLYVM